MTVSLVHCTPDAEALIIKMARVSSSNPDNPDAGLLGYLIKHKHWSPFEMASMCVKIETERDISAQICRHRSFSFQEFSQRYASPEPAQIPHLRKQAAKNRQSSTDDFDPGKRTILEHKVATFIVGSQQMYWQLVDAGVAKECARRILPMCSPTTLYMHGTLRSWIHYLEIRTGEDTQLEHRQIALDIKDIFEKQFPIISQALGWL
jgi:thymidylate synthase (FAD)